MGKWEIFHCHGVITRGSVINKMFCLCQNHGKAKGETLLSFIILLFFWGITLHIGRRSSQQKNLKGLKASYKPSTTSPSLLPPVLRTQCHPNDASHRTNGWYGIVRRFRRDWEVVTIFSFGQQFFVVRMMNSPLKNSPAFMKW